MVDEMESVPYKISSGPVSAHRQKKDTKMATIGKINFITTEKEGKNRNNRLNKFH